MQEGTESVGAFVEKTDGEIFEVGQKVIPGDDLRIGTQDSYDI